MSIVDQHQNSTLEELSIAIAQTESKKDKTKLLSLLRQKMRAQEIALKEAIKNEEEDSKEEKKALKNTHEELLNTRKAFQESFRSMNAIINGKSMLKHIDDFQNKVENYINKTTAFNLSLIEHMNKLVEIKNK